MALYAYYKSGLGLFVDDGHGEFEDADGNTVSEGFLVTQAAQKMQSYKLKNNSWEFAKDDVFASQPGIENYRLITTDSIKFMDAQYVVNTTYFEEVQYLPEYIIS